MSGYADKLQKKAGEVLQPGENLLWAIRTQPSGSTVGMAVGGLVGATIAGRQAAKATANMGEGTLASQWPQGRFAVALTDKRVLTFNYTAMGKPKDLTAQFPIDQVAAVDLDKKKVSNAVRFTFSDGSAVQVECAKLEKVGDFVSAFQHVKGSNN